jgi:putative transposase
MGALIEIKVGEQYVYGSRRYQITTVDDQLVQLRTVDGAPTILYQSLATLRRAADQRRLIKAQEAPITTSPEKVIARLPAAQAAQLLLRLDYVRTVLTQFSGRLSRTEFPALIEAVTKTSGEHRAPGYTTVCNWRKSYLTAGGNCIALIPDTYRPHRRHLSRQPEEIKALIKRYVKECYWVFTPLTKTALIETIQLAIQNLNTTRPDTRKYREPSITTLYRIICELDAFETRRKQHGRRSAIRQNRWGAALPEPDWLLERVEADTQLLHLFVADKNGRVIGRPYLTVFLEIKTRHVIGWHISFNPPSLDTTLIALKASLHSDNPYGGLATFYIFDNGPEYIAKALRQMMLLLGAEVSFCEPGEPNQKPHIEAFFRTWSTQIVHSMSGTTFSNTTKRGDYDSEANAIYTLEQVRDFFSRWLDTYHRDLHSELEMSPDEAWAKCLEHELEPRQFDQDDLRRYFWRREMVTPSSQNRVRYSNVHWHGGAVGEMAHRWPLRKKLCLYYDPGDLGNAWVFHPDYPDDIQPLEPVHKQYQQGLTLHFHQEIHARKLELRKRRVYVCAREARVQLLWEISQTNNKQQRLQHHRALERGDVTNDDLVAIAPQASTERVEVNPSLHEYRSDTPDEFSVVRS